jgi:prepilin-type processing-associated H-X9-DG protein
VSMLLVGVEMCTAGRGHETASRVRCGSNLRQLGLAMLMYSNENRQQFPRAHYVDGATPTAYTAPGAANPFASDGPGPNDVSAIAFLLLRTQDIYPEVFLCASTNRQRWEGNRQQSSNFTDDSHLSYSFHNGYADSAAIAAKATWNNTLGSDFAIAADMNPGTEAVTTVLPTSPTAMQRQANSLNHQQDGQNVLYADAHVESHNTVFAGARRNGVPDNIYKASDVTQNAQGGGMIWASPGDREDSVLLPVATTSPQASPLPLAGLPWNWIVGLIVVIVFLAIYLVLRRLDQAPPDEEPEPAP